MPEIFEHDRSLTEQQEDIRRGRQGAEAEGWAASYEFRFPVFA